jgi:amidophosphoribosyltransferase
VADRLPMALVPGQRSAAAFKGNMIDKFKDECGVFGIFGHPEAANLTYLGLYALQHRGQESSGIAVSDGTVVRLSRAMGYVADAFDTETLTSLPGTRAIGHVRYSTTGSSQLSNAQPFLIDCAHGQIAIGHNGNLINAQELRDELVRQGSIFQSTSDTEVVLHLYARSRARTIEEAVVEAVTQGRGAFSFVLLTKDRLIAVRDPHGFRPLALGRLGDALVVCSETCAMDLIGATYVRDIEPGEVLVISAEGMKSLKPFAPAKLAHCVFEHVYFARPDSYVFGTSVNEVRTNLGRNLAREQLVDADVVVPVPDSGVCAAMGFAEESGIPLRMGLIRNHYVGRTFIEPQSAIRHFGVRVKLNPVRSILNGRRVILIDDSIVRGTTSRKIVKMVRAAGAKEVHVRISCPPTISPCFYGIDTPRRSELIAATHTLDEITKYLDADSVAYLSLDGLLNAVGSASDSYCSSCYTGRYPVEFPRDETSYLQLALKLDKTEAVVK